MAINKLKKIADDLNDGEGGALSEMLDPNDAWYKRVLTDEDRASLKTIVEWALDVEPNEVRKAIGLPPL